MVGEINWGILDPNAAAKAAGSFQQGQANRLAMQQVEQERATNALALQSRQQAMSDEAAMRQAYAQSGGDANKLVASLRGAGLHQKAMEVEGQLATQQAAQRKAKIDEAIQATQLMENYANQIFVNPTQENATRAVTEFATSVGQDPAQYLPQVQALGDNPEAIKRWAAGHVFKAKDMLPKLQELNLGGTTRLASIDPLTGKVIGQQDFAKTMTPGERAADVRAKRANELKAQEVEGVVGKQTRDIEMKLADDYRTESKGFAETSTAMKKIMGSIEQADKNPGAALSAGTAFMKLLDPNSVVRETELGMALNASGWFDRATNIAQTLQSGRVMTATQKKNLQDAAETLFEEAKAAQREIDASYKTRATQYGADPNRVIVERGQSTFKGAPKIGTIQDGYKYKGGDPADSNSWEKQ